MTTRKIALVTGGSRGLGKDMALALAGKGIDVVLTYLSNKAEADKVVADITQSGGKAVALQFDVAQISAFDGFLQQVKEALSTIWSTDTFDFLINNAGIGASIPIDQLTEDTFDEFVNIHFKGVFFLTQKALRMINNKGGVVFISSGAARFYVPGYAVYAASKGAVEVFARYIAKEYGQRGIRANVVAPGPIETDFNNATIRNNPQTKNFLASQTALGRVGNADDIGSVVAFLCTEDAKWVNGQRIEVAGGINL
ncbi:SDR family oxidoreductase [Cytophagaceae bacterium YF14B1]|uniref:SDR family oxidoreductase n=1 Tax=Xanthocytophaga flava TaxID=3048013 RepID=A0AAE3QTT2_9BACT|nr:SDR family oxidoreductase [Xanthocytophaga flavus]MDJ1485337.1 SDR family oxidoreductase [Xanthocytophaga flavus]